MKKISRKDRWIADTQMYQRVAKVAESSYETLAKDWEAMHPPKPPKIIDLVEDLVSAELRNLRANSDGGAPSGEKQNLLDAEILAARTAVKEAIAALEAKVSRKNR